MAPGPIVRIPLVSLEDRSGDFLAGMQKHGYVVLTDIGEGDAKCARIMTCFREFCNQGEEQKREGTSKRVYKSERGVPMWYCGYEAEQMREAFRVSTGMSDIGSWPSQDFEDGWMDLTVVPPSDKADDKSVSYAVHYPNDRGGQQEEGINIKEHFDPSLFVVEPVSEVAGLQVYDQASEEWVCVEENCEAGKEIVVFGGKALERVTEGNLCIKAAKHRVAQHKEKSSRYVFIFEQKYAAFFPSPAFDD